MYRVFIDGREGTTGLRIVERLAARRDISLIEIDPALRKDAAERQKCLLAADAAFLCLPDDAAREAVALSEGGKAIIIDASTAHRVAPGWAYGFPELSDEHRAAIAGGNHIAVPGCHASGFIALAYPLAKAGLIPDSFPLTCYSLTGYSGGGKKMIAQYENEGRESELGSPRQYGLTQNHKHLKEMTYIPGLKRAPVFAPIVDDYYSGMLVTVPVFPELFGVSLAEIRALYARHYAGSRMVRVIEDFAGAFEGSNNLAGKDYMEIIITGNDERALLSARFDNLGKGASGAAVQCMNIALGMDEAEGLSI